MPLTAKNIAYARLMFMLRYIFKYEEYKDLYYKVLDLLPQFNDSTKPEKPYDYPAWDHPSYTDKWFSSLFETCKSSKNRPAKRAFSIADLAFVCAARDDVIAVIGNKPQHRSRVLIDEICETAMEIRLISS